VTSTYLSIDCLESEVSKERAVYIELNTHQQSDCALWGEERKRITASNIGTILSRKSAETKKFIENVMHNIQFKAKATDYGTAKESTACNIYRTETRDCVHACGLMINPLFSHIAGTPDGKVCCKQESGLLEIKCPFWCRDMKLKYAIERAVLER
jgi:hypothetical protein